MNVNITLKQQTIMVENYHRVNVYLHFNILVSFA